MKPGEELVDFRANKDERTAPGRAEGVQDPRTPLDNVGSTRRRECGINPAFAPATVGI